MSPSSEAQPNVGDDRERNNRREHNLHILLFFSCLSVLENVSSFVCLFWKSNCCIASLRGWFFFFLLMVVVFFLSLRSLLSQKTILQNTPHNQAAGALFALAAAIFFVGILGTGGLVITFRLPGVVAAVSVFGEPPAAGVAPVLGGAAPPLAGVL